MSGGKKAHSARPHRKLVQRLQRLHTRHARQVATGLLALTALSLQPTMNALQAVHSSGELHLVGISSPTTFFQQDGHTHGLQYELAQQFASELGVKLVVDPVDSPQQVLRAIRHNKAQLALTGLTADDPRLDRLRVSDPVLEVQEKLIQRSDQLPPASLADLAGKRIAVIAGSAEARDIRLALSSQDVSDVQLVEVRQGETLDLLSLLDASKVDYVALSAIDFDAYRPLFPNLRDGLTLDRSDAVSWVFAKSEDQSLYQAAQDFLARKQADGTLDRLVSFYGAGDAFNVFGVKNFHRDIAERLPRYQGHFEKASDTQGVDWRLLAAIAYQESHWDPSATSPTGVKGLMMLTQGTADLMGVSNRSHAGESIRGGAAYFKKILDQVPATVPEPDRTWMALAAYNMGPGHMIDARKLTASRKGDPNSWLDVSRNLLTLASENRRHGKPAPDVSQAMHYVQQVRRYYDAIALNVSHAEGKRRVALLDLDISTLDRRTR